MTNHCRTCGIEIPNGQSVCSVCYGDPYYGKDGYLLQMMNDEWEQELERQRQEEQQEHDTSG